MNEDFELDVDGEEVAPEEEQLLLLPDWDGIELKWRQREFAEHLPVELREAYLALSQEERDEYDISRMNSGSAY